MLRFIVLFFNCVFLSQSLLAQLVISGKVLDPLTGESLAYVNIGIKGKNIGTTSLSDGTFSISIPSEFINDSLTFSLIAYTDFKLPIQASGKKVIPLFRNPQQLQEVNIAISRLPEKKFGLKKRSAIHFIDASINQTDIFEIAQVVKLPATASKLSSINLYISDSNPDSVKFRINIYKFDGSLPKERLNTSAILKSELLKEGWLHCNISEFNISAKNEVVIAIEFLPSAKRKKAIAYEVKLGGRAKSFFRKTSLGEWLVPPHHYLMYLTALTEEPSGTSEEEAKESTASKNWISRFVKDTFSVFIHLPESYKKTQTKTYPLILLLDANAYFDLVIDFWPAKTKEDFPEAIIIGIGYANVALMDSLRQRDYTSQNALHVDSCTICGGADNFRNFIEKELLPYVHKNFRTNPNEVSLMGHSLGGYFTAWSLLMDVKEKNKQIKNYICISPSINYADHYVLKSIQALSHLNINSLQKKSYFSFGEFDDEINSTPKGVFTNVEKSLMLLKVKTKFEMYPGLQHMETPVVGFEQGLRFVFAD